MPALRKRLTYANVVATLALFLALTGGVVWAAGKIGSGDIAKNAIKSKHIKNGQVKEKDLGANAVGPNSLQGNAVGSDQLAPDSVGARELKTAGVTAEDIDPGAVSPRLFAHVSQNGTLAESAGVVSASRTSTGEYVVDFDRDLNGCVGVASVGFGFGPGVVGAGALAQVRMDKNNTPSRVGVTIYRGFTFADVSDSDFHLIVAC